MNIVPVDLSTIPNITRSNSRTAKQVAEFLDYADEAGLVAEVTIDGDLNRNGEPLTIGTVRTSITTYVQKNHLPVDVFARSGRLFLRRSADK